MTILAQSYPASSVRARYFPAALLVITVMATLTVSTPNPDVFGVPRPFLFTIIFAFYMYVSLRWKVGIRYVQFALAYLAAFVPATLYSINTLSVRWPSFLESLPMLATFCILASYFERWLSRNSDDVKIKWIHMILLYFFIISVLELVFFSQFVAFRGAFYPNQSAVLHGMSGGQRELEFYGGRPTALFSEPSNFAKYLSIVVAAYMTITKCSKKSVFVLVAFYLLVRSVSYFYAAPVMALAWWNARSFGGAIRRRSPQAKKLIIAGAIGACLVIGIFATQQRRIGNAVGGEDTSLLGRIVLPLHYLLADSDRLLIGAGLTPQDDIKNATIMSYAIATGNLNETIEVMAATSTTITFLVGIGVIGLVVFYAAMFLMQQRGGVWIATVFIVSNIINAGYNQSTTFVLSALLIGLTLYQLKLAKVNGTVRRETPAAASIQPAFRIG
jgi:hypothetical protein